MNNSNNQSQSTRNWKKSNHFPPGLEKLRISQLLFFLASPQWGVVELDPQQVPHSNLGRVVNYKLIVKEGITFMFTHPCLHCWTHRYIYTLSEKGGGWGEREHKLNPFFEDNLDALTHHIWKANFNLIPLSYINNLNLRTSTNILPRYFFFFYL